MASQPREYAGCSKWVATAGAAGAVGGTNGLFTKLQEGRMAGGGDVRMGGECGGCSGDEGLCREDNYCAMAVRRSGKRGERELRQ